MSAYAEWKCGMITDAEYATICRQEEYEAKIDDFSEEEAFEDEELDEF